MEQRSLRVPTAVDEIDLAWLSTLCGPAGSFTLTPIGGEFGLSGTTFRLDVRLLDSNVRRLAVKFAAAGPTAREIRFFEDCAARTPLRLPEFVTGAVDAGADRGMVVLEYLPDVRQGDVLVGCARTEATTLARVLARLHATWWGAADPALAALAELDEPLANVPRVRDGRLSVFLERHGDSLSSDTRELVLDLGQRLESAHDELRAGPQTLIHRDYHLDNMLFTTTPEPIVIDWQGAAVGPPAVDVARLMVECLTLQQRRQYGSTVLAAYLQELEGHGIPRPEGRLRHEIVLALLRSLAGTINWLGRTPPDPVGSRKEVLGRNSLRNISDALEDLRD